MLSILLNSYFEEVIEIKDYSISKIQARIKEDQNYYFRHVIFTKKWNPFLVTYRESQKKGKRGGESINRPYLEGKKNF